MVLVEEEELLVFNQLDFINQELTAIRLNIE